MVVRNSNGYCGINNTRYSRHASLVKAPQGQGLPLLCRINPTAFSSVCFRPTSRIPVDKQTSHPQTGARTIGRLITDKPFDPFKHEET